jgi:hypothetical protein
MGAIRAWHSVTGAERYDQYAELSVSQLMRASGYKGKPNAKKQRQYLQTLLTLTQVWVQVPTCGYKNGREYHKQLKWQRVLNTDQVTHTRGLFSDDPEYRNDEVWDVRFHPAEFWFHMFFGREPGQRRFIELSDQVLEYDSLRQGAELKLAFYWAAQLRMAKGQPEIAHRAVTIIEDAQLTPYPNDRGREIEKLVAAHERLVKDGILPGVTYDDPGPGFAPRKRLEGMRVIVQTG